MFAFLKRHLNRALNSVNLTGVGRMPKEVQIGGKLYRRSRRNWRGQHIYRDITQM